MDIGEDKTPVPDWYSVLRLAKPSKDHNKNGSVLAIQLDVLKKGFELSTDDKDSTPPHLSVWVYEVTTPEQAYNHLEKNSPRKLVLRLKVEDVCSIEAKINSLSIKLLQILWIKIDKDLPGSEGHSGIVGLEDSWINSKLQDKGISLTSRERRDLRKFLRSELADLASKDCWLLDI